MTDDPFTVQMIPIDSIVANPANVNQGDIGSIATAIAVDGFHGSVLLMDRGKKQAPMIVVGEHRWRALAALQRDGWDDPHGAHVSYDELAERVALPPLGTVPAQVQTMDDIRATRKMVADNRASALATTDDAALAELLTELVGNDELFGSLYDADDLDQLIADLDSGAAGFGRPGGDLVECPSCGARFVPGE